MTRKKTNWSTDHRVRCPVEIPRDLATGEEANVFRVVPDTDDEVLLDFIRADKDGARVVARVRVAKSTLDAIKRRLRSSIQETPHQPFSIPLIGSN